MDSLSEFAINIDYTSCKKLYDYGKQQWMHRPDMGWDMNNGEEVQDELCASIDNEALRTQIHQMDRTLGKKPFYEKTAKRTEQHGDLSCGSAPRLLPVYKPGDVIRGRLVVRADAPICAERLVIKASGKAEVKIRAENPGGGYGESIAREPYMSQEVVVWQTCGAGDVSDEAESLLGDEDALPASAKLPPGDHEIAFDFRIPDDARSSCPPLLVGSHDCAHVFYRVKAELVMDDRLKRNIITTHGVWVEASADRSLHYKHNRPLTVDHNLTSGAIISKVEVLCSATLPSGVFVKNSVVPLKLEVQNLSDAEVESVSGVVVMSGEARAGTGKVNPRRTINHKAIKKVHGAVAAKTVEVISLDLPLDFSHCSVDSNLIPAGNMEDCTLIDMKYEIDVELKRKGMHRNLDFRIPIDIGTENNSVF